MTREHATSMDDICLKFALILEAARLLHREGFVDPETYASLVNEIMGEMAKEKDKLGEQTNVPLPFPTDRSRGSSSGDVQHVHRWGRCTLGCTLGKSDTTDCDGT